MIGHDIRVEVEILSVCTDRFAERGEGGYKSQPSTQAARSPHSRVRRQGNEKAPAYDVTAFNQLR